MDKGLISLIYKELLKLNKKKFALNTKILGLSTLIWVDEYFSWKKNPSFLLSLSFPKKHVITKKC